MLPLQKVTFHQAAFYLHITPNHFNASIIASTFSGVGCLRGFLSVLTAFGASYIGNPKLRFTSAIKAVWTLKPYLDSIYVWILLYVGLGSYLAIFNIHFHFYFVRSFYTRQERHHLYRACMREHICRSCFFKLKPQFT